jgi:hypothetical protein
MSKAIAIAIVLIWIPTLVEGDPLNIFAKSSRWTMNIAGEIGKLEMPGGKAIRTTQGGWKLNMDVVWQERPGKFMAGSSDGGRKVAVKFVVESPRDGTRFRCAGSVAPRDPDTMSGKCRWGDTTASWHAKKQTGAPVTGFTSMEKSYYEGIVRYKQTSLGWWMRCKGVVQNRPTSFFPQINTYNQVIHSLVMDVLGFRPDRTRNDKEIWRRVVKVWNWLQRNELTSANPNYRKAKSYIERLHSWPSIADIAHMYSKYGGIYWGTCMSRAQLFATLLYTAGIPPDRYAIAESYWKPAYSQHMYVILYIGNRWIYLDPIYIGERLAADNVSSVGSGPADYIHPRVVKLLPGSKLSGVPLVR